MRCHGAWFQGSLKIGLGPTARYIQILSYTVLLRPEKCIEIHPNHIIRLVKVVHAPDLETSLSPSVLLPARR